MQAQGKKGQTNDGRKKSGVRIVVCNDEVDDLIPIHRA